PPEPRPGWAGVRDARRPGPASPQPPCRLEAVVGPIRLAGMAEDCLSVHVWSPGLRERRPVLVFLHGGGYAAGAGAQDWYDGARLADEGGIVVVTVNYRLGALGFLCPSELSDDLGTGNAGLHDQVAALRWVRDNIANFGGDPDRVTLAGQSAGALSALAMMSSPRAAGLFHRVVLQSTPTGIAPRSPGDATAVTEQYLHLLDLKPNQIHRLRTLPVERLLDAQATLMGTAPPLRLEPPFQLVVDGDLVAADLVGTPGWADGMDRLVGSTRDEVEGWVRACRRLAGADRAGAVAVARDFLGDAAEAEFDRIAERAPGADPRKVLSLLATDFFFERDVPEIAAGARRSYVYRFDWAPAGAPFGASHCLELPFVFGTLDAWREAPMLAGADPADQMALADAMAPAWAAFARTGNPAHDGIPAWPTHQDGGVMHFASTPSSTG
ncbi:MAG: carboxylesterase/lipase family protein, partial [Actinophytocola sp.]|uniref:carboxylesterase/lipase family protein n=1 Tax=Actinophytocola sp. TaxID=1872138 RepID=UPI003D6B0859